MARESFLAFRKYSVVVAAVLTLLACQSYQPYNRMDQYGYLDARVGEKQFQVAFVGKQTESALEAREAALLRSAEITVQNGFEYFVATDEQVGSLDRAVTTHQPNQFVGVVSNTTIISKPTVHLTIEAYSEPPPGDKNNVYVATDVIRFSSVDR